MNFASIILFSAYTFFLGYTITSFVKNSDNFLERNLMRIGFGLALLPFLGMALNLLRIPIDWRILLALSITYPLYHIIKNKPMPRFGLRVTKADISILVMLAIFIANFYVYASGAFNYPYLEDDDSWGHATSVKYVSVEKTVFVDKQGIFQYIDPYPPAYDLLFGVLHQVNDSVYWTLKFFNALIVSLSTIFFYFFVKEFTQDRNKALFASFALASIPAFMSHFIWAISLTVTLYFVAFYAIERIKHDKKWWIIAGLVMVTTLTSSPTHSAYFGLFFILYLLVKIIFERKILLYPILSGMLGIMLSFIFWWLPMFLKYGFYGTLNSMGIGLASGNTIVSIAGTGDRAYSFLDFFIAQKQNMINNPIGIGIFLSVLTLIAIVFLFFRFRDLLKKENSWLAITLVWFVFTLYAVNAAKMPIKLSPFRAWMLLAIPVCILATEGAFNLMNISKKSIGNIGKYTILITLLVGVFFTSTQQKIAVNTATWPPGAFWTSFEEINGYVWIKNNLPPNSNIFAFDLVSNGPIIGMDMFICHWCDEVRKYQLDGFNQTAAQNYDWLKKELYKYVVIDGQTAKKFGINETNNKVQDIINSKNFRSVFHNNGLILFELE